MGRRDMVRFSRWFDISGILALGYKALPCAAQPTQAKVMPLVSRRRRSRRLIAYFVRARTNVVPRLDARDWSVDALGWQNEIRVRRSIIRELHCCAYPLDVRSIPLHDIGVGKVGIARCMRHDP